MSELNFTIHSRIPIHFSYLGNYEKLATRLDVGTAQKQELNT